MNANEQRIREFAYQIWQSEGKPHGHAKRHWEMACKLAESDVQQSATTPSAKTEVNGTKLLQSEATPLAKPTKKPKALEAATTAAKTDTAKKTKAKAPEKAEAKKPAAAKKTNAIESQAT